MVTGVVLVVEDNPVNASLAQAVLSHDWHRVLTAADAATALDIARRRLPDLAAAGRLTRRVDDRAGRVPGAAR